MSVGRCVRRDYGFVGCGSDVLGITDQLCSGRRNCTVRVPNSWFDDAAQKASCPEDFRNYLRVSYQCLDGQSLSVQYTLCITGCATTGCSTGCAVAQHCCNDDQLSQWENAKMGILTPCRSETPENFITKIGHFDYVVRCNTHAKFCGNRPRGVRLSNSGNITSCDFMIPSNPTHPFPSPLSCRRLQQKRLDVSYRATKRRVFGEGCSFWDDKI